MAGIDEEAEKARLDTVFAEAEAAERAEFEKAPAELKAKGMAQHKRDLETAEARTRRLLEQDHAQMFGNACQLLKDGACKTRWERVLATAYVSLYNMHVYAVKASAVELNVLRNFAGAVDERLGRAEAAARAQDNHHYYKMFADAVRRLLDKL